MIDSMSLEIYKTARCSRNKICKEEDYTQPYKGFCTSQNLHYYGYKLHVVCSIKGVFHFFDLTAVLVHDIHFLKDIRSQLSYCVKHGGRGYLSQTI
uniref:transposase n=1 Tax=Flavobacterium daejeonense TaxID=350893 RepID=UPI0009DE1F27|nr:transposase [Flavobacterium daejeonense]